MNRINQKEHFQEVYPQGTTVESSRFKITKKLLGEISGKKILDLGCSNGELLAYLTKNNLVMGLDISPEAIKLAKKRGYQAKVFDISRKLPFPDEFFDFVVAEDILEHLTDTDFVLSEINRVLKKEGKFLLCFPNVNNFASYWLMFFGDLPPMMSARYRSVHLRDFTLRTFRLALSNNGFKVLKYQGTNFFPLLLGEMGFLGRGLAKIFPRFSIKIAILAQKKREVLYSSEQVYQHHLKWK